jgi:hypothetical protein
VGGGKTPHVLGLGTIEVKRLASNDSAATYQRKQSLVLSKAGLAMAPKRKKSLLLF